MLSFSYCFKFGHRLLRTGSKDAECRMTLPVIHSLWQTGPRNIHLDGFNAATGLVISGILTFGRGDEQGPAAFAS